MVDASPLRTLDEEAASLMVAAIDQAKEEGDTLGGIFEVVAWGLPAGLGSYVSYDTKLDGRLAGAMMSIQAIKGVEIGVGFEGARRPGSRVHDPIVADESAGRAGSIGRASNRAGGLEGGVTTGEPLVVRAAMKPISTLRKTPAQRRHARWIARRCGRRAKRRLCCSRGGRGGRGHGGPRLGGRIPRKIWWGRDERGQTELRVVRRVPRRARIR